MHYKLVYFDVKARAEVSRMLFHVAGQNFDDHRLKFEEWAQAKSMLPFHQAPVLEVTENSKTHHIAQSHAIERFLASRFHLFGKDDLERAQIDMMGEQIVDLFNTLLHIYRKKDSDENKKLELDEAIEEQVPKGLKLIQNLLELNTHNNGFLVGSSISLVDIQLINFYDWLRERKEEVLDKLPLLKQHEEFIKSNPKLADYLKKNEHVRLTLMFHN